MADETTDPVLCPSCGDPMSAEEAIPRPDPYASDIYGDETPVVLCDYCRTERADDI